MRVSRKRWRFAQERQVRHQDLKLELLTGQETELIRRARARSELVHAWLASLGAKCDGAVLEVGSGPHGLVWHWPQPHALTLGVDPLAAHYRRRFAFLQLGAASPIAARGEELPVATGSVDLLVSDNVLDHVQDPAACLREFRRVLKPGGTLYLTVNVHHAIWGTIAGMYNWLVDAGLPISVSAFPSHPHHFSAADLKTLLSSAAFDRLVTVRAGPETPAASMRRPHEVLKYPFFRNERMEAVCPTLVTGDAVLTWTPRA